MQYKPEGTNIPKKPRTTAGALYDLDFFNAQSNNYRDIVKQNTEDLYDNTKQHFNLETYDSNFLKMLTNLQTIADSYKKLGGFGATSRRRLRNQLQTEDYGGINTWNYLKQISGIDNDVDLTRALSTYLDTKNTNWDLTYSDAHGRLATIFGRHGTDPNQKTFVGLDLLTAQNKHNAELFDSGRDQFLKARMTEAGKNVNYFDGVNDMKGYLDRLVSLAEENNLAEGTDYIKKNVLANNLYGKNADALLETLATKVGGDNPFARQAFINNARKTLSGLKGFGKGYSASSFGANVDFGDFQSYLDPEYRKWYDANKNDVASTWNAAHAPVPAAGTGTTNTTATTPNNWKGKNGNSYKSGGNINYFKGGGKSKKSPKKSSSNKQGSIEEQIIGLVQAAMQGDQLATQAIQQVMQAAQSGDEQAVQMAQMILQTMQELQGAAMARQGTKLGYISKLNMFKNGGHTCAKCHTEKLKCGGKKKLALNGDKFDKISKLCKGKRV